MLPGVGFTTNLLLVLTIIADAVVVLGVAAVLAATVSKAWRARLRGVAAVVGRRGLPAALVVAIVTTAGSLYYSEHAGYIPCKLCWYQRILMYPLVFVLGVAVLRRRRMPRGAWATAVPFVALGAGLSTYHWLIERVPSLASGSSCSAIAPCTVPYFEKLGFVTLAWMCLSSFLLIGLLVTAVAQSERRAVAPVAAEAGVISHEPRVAGMQESDRP